MIKNMHKYLMDDLGLAGSTEQSFRNMQHIVIYQMYSIPLPQRSVKGP